MLDVMKRLASGFPASQLFSELVENDSTLTGRVVSRLFAEEFPDVSGDCVMIIRRWHGFGHRDQLSDADVDRLVVHFLIQAGYMTS